MVKRKEILPQPKSRFINVQCSDCGSEQIVFDRASTIVKCNVCGKPLVKPLGGKAVIMVKKSKQQFLS
ncbi:MAG: 30S ribosomal protein S27e [Candidatus Jordarchaeaceae archaeon]|nr:30S ribosomal protein S27e [Candidatus Jordarchaeia archaeon]MBS7269665.1 30S ribosomal protein S27e [Candidatus Jordarchaeia archaeon]MBS7279693.1 30S ribosomal protein S27e [Candidatus Jordarchaeia archaeon]